MNEDELKAKALERAKEAVKNKTQMPDVEYKHDASKDQFSDYWVRAVKNIPINDDVEMFGDRLIIFERCEIIFKKAYDKLKYKLHEHGVDVHHYVITYDFQPKPYEENAIVPNGIALMYVFTDIPYDVDIFDMFGEIFLDCGFVIIRRAE